LSDFTFIEQKPSQGAEHPLESGFTIGREGCDITLADSEVSRRHAAIQIAAGELSIEDLGSTNGTLVNGERITERRSLREGDEVQIGSTVWRLRAPAGATRLSDVPSDMPSGATRLSQTTTLRPSAPEPPAPEPPRAEPPAPEPVAAPEPPAPEPPAPEPALPEPPVAEPVTAEAPPARPPSAAPAPAPAAPRHGDVPRPDFQPSAIRRVVPSEAPTAFVPETQATRKGSAATRGGATLMATIVVALTTAGVVLYYITEPFK
jgi:predicted component of type VI protein secretion system